MPRKEINYQNTIIYKIVCNDLNIKELYVGHTTDFRRRKNGHKSRCSSSDIKIYETIRKNGGWDDWSMIEIEKYPCNDSNEANARERHWFETLEAKLNTVNPQRSKKEYYEQNKVNIGEKHKEYVKNNKEKIQKIMKQYWEENKEKLSKDKKKYWLENKEKLKESRKIYCEENKEKIRELRHIGYERNKDKINEIAKLKMTCICGSVIRSSDKARHYKTIKHKLFIEGKEI